MALVYKIEDRIGGDILETIQPSDIQSLTKDVLPTGKPSTWNQNVIGPARAVINCAAKNEWRGFIKIENFKEDPVIKLHPSDGAAELLMANCEGFQRLYIAAGHYHGLRPSDALAMTWDGVDLKAREFSFIVPKPNKLKTIVMDDDFFIEIAGLAQDKGHVFPWRNRSGVYNWLTPLCEKLGVDCRYRRPSR
jgi:hypothetical protein